MRNSNQLLVTNPNMKNWREPKTKKLWNTQTNFIHETKHENIMKNQNQLIFINTSTKNRR